MSQFLDHLRQIDFTATPRLNDINAKATAQVLKVPPNFEKIITPARIIITGPTQSGKSRFIFNLIKHRTTMFSDEFQRIIYCLPPNCFNLHAEFLDNLKDVCADTDLKIMEDMPNIDELALDIDLVPKLIVFDDLMRKAFNSTKVLDLITQTSHHANVTVIFTTQNVFLPSKYGKSIRYNCSTTVIFFDGNDVQMLNILSMQMFPNGNHFLQQCFDWIYQHSHIVKARYVLIDGAPSSLLSRQMRVRTNIFPDINSPAKPVFFFPDDD